MVLCQRQNLLIGNMLQPFIILLQEWEALFTIICGEQMPLQQEQVLEKNGRADRFQKMLTIPDGMM